MTQRERVLQKIEQDGYVDNFWAIQNFILRLGALIHDLSKEGIQFKRAYGKELEKDKNEWKNFYYIYQKPAVQNELPF